jgi:glycosyltransferase involved in cell wall biosynthesis
MDRPPYATVVVCTRNRSARLVEACESMLAMDYPADRWHLLVVDNRSTDDTPEVARRLAEAHPGRVRLIEEPEIGLSAARNAGIRAAEGEVIAFIDDDAFPVPGWLATVAEALTRPGVMAVGGPVEPLFQGELPPWFLDRYLPYLTVWDRGDREQELTYNEYPRGANMAFHRDALDRFGTFSTRLGRKGRSLLSCEELELCLRIERGGGRVLYLPAAHARHRVEVDRLVPGWIVRRFGAQGRSEAIIDWRHGGWAGLGRGLRLYLANARAGWRQRRDPAGGELLARCQLRALTGYLGGTVEAVASVDRWRPEGVARWPPPAV